MHNNPVSGEYSALTKIRDKITLVDKPGIHIQGGTLTPGRYEADVEFIINVYDRKSLSGTTISAFTDPTNPAPLKSHQWDFVDTYNVP